MKIVGKLDWCLIYEVDPQEFRTDSTYTIEVETDGVTRRWQGIRPQREDDGTTRIYLPITRH
ncbi:MAG TPA: hypothetical protein VN689_01080 [Burkholderiales bacterium]|nr:hypothetical protein [Burkholderiales bacterium]